MYLGCFKEKIRELFCAKKTFKLEQILMSFFCAFILFKFIFYKSLLDKTKILSANVNS